MLTAVILLIALILMILGNALFVAVEFSFLTVDRNDVRRREAEGSTSAALLEKSLKKTATNLSGAQLGITLTSLIVGYLTSPSLGVLLTEGLGLTGIGDAAAAGIATTAAFIIATFTQMVFGELVPKNWAIAEPMRVADIVVRPQKVFMVLLGWLVRALNGAANWVLQILGFNPEEEVANTRTAEELRAMVSRSGDEGTLDAATAELVARSIEFGDRTATDVMTPRPRVHFVEDESVADVLGLVSKTGHARFPVLGERGVDDVTGVVHYNRLLSVPHEKRTTTAARDLADPILVVTESMTLDPLMRELRNHPLQFAVVVDEYGGTDGIVTLEDLVEEIVGEIDDEQDTLTKTYTHIDDSTLLVSGLMRPDELGDILDLELPEGEESDTIGGYITEQVDRMPLTGDSITVEAIDHENRDEEDLPTRATVSFTVVKMARRRVGRVRVVVTRPEPEEEDDRNWFSRLTDRDDDAERDDETGAPDSSAATTAAVRPDREDEK